jgi:hypothetical protein
MQDDKNPEITTSQKHIPKGGVKYDLQRYLMDQLLEALSELNIHATCVAHGCTREYALRHHELLLDHYNNHGGTANYERYRSRYEKLCEYERTCHFSDGCELALIQTDFKKCPLWKMSKGRCGSCCSAHATLPNNIIFPEEFACAI